MAYHYSKNLRKIIENARSDALSLGQNSITTEHFLLGILKIPECTAYDILISLGINPDSMQKLLENRLRVMNVIPSYGNVPLTKNAERVLQLTYLESRKMNSLKLNSAHLLLAIMKEAEEVSSDFLLMSNINYGSVKGEILKNRVYNNSFETEEVKRPEKKSDTPVLDNFGQDFTKMASENKLDPVIGREDEILRVAQILSRRKKNNPVLIGEPGVGKTAIVEGLALKIIQNDVPHSLLKKRIVNIDLGNIISGTKFRGQFEERIKGLMDELTRCQDVILFIDELHVLVGAGSAQGSLDAANLFKPALARGDLQCIGATTYDEYKKYIEKDGALERRFQKITVSPPGIEQTRIILQSLKSRYEEHHKVKYTDEALEACIQLSEKYITDKFLPDKAFDLLDEAGAHIALMNFNAPKELINLYNKKDKQTQLKNEAIKNQNFEEAARLRDIEKRLSEEVEAAELLIDEKRENNYPIVEERTVADIVEMITGIPVQKVIFSEADKYLKMEDILEQSIVGQEEAISGLAKSIRRTRTGIKNPRKPIGSFLFLGPTGVGKTELAKVLAS
ncbi:MAG: ATP-dependent Clp protease ATP-binding subunit, partial [Candidatus Marinimicrobia bacterium]|nr:ATP-dependent Clp protease ATP-binding subunit [Candidatus Neomarinimicrobiota bacterium]